jgi:hypothetical protein
MLADRVAREADRLDALRSERQAARTARDAEILAAFLQLDGEFVTMLRTVVGPHTLITMSTQTVTEAVPTRTFATITRTVTDVTSVLYGFSEQLRFTPVLEFREPGQFGVIRLDWNGRPPAPADGLVVRLLTRGILMQDLAHPALMVPGATGSERLIAAALEDVLARLIIRD